MTYATRTDMTKRFGEADIIALTDIDRSADAIVDAVLDPALAEADSVIDSYLRERYSLPLPSFPPALVGAAVSIAHYLLHTGPIPDAVQKRYDLQIAWLKDLSRGTATLGLQDEPALAPESAVVGIAGRRVFTADNLRDYARGGS